MHPGPMNRDVEIAGSVADGPQSVITHQVSNGLAVRMAILAAISATPAGFMSSEHRGTIRAENAEVLQQVAYPADQFVLRMHAPECARRARPGSFIHIQCHADIPMRRPLSIMRVDPDAGWIEVLYKIVGTGMNALSKASTGDTH